MSYRVLVVSNMSPKPSAPLLGQFVDNQVAALKKEKVEVDYCKPSWNGDSWVHKFFRYPVFFLQFLISFILKRERYDIVHVHYYFPTIFLAIAYYWLVSKKTKIIVTCHGSDLYLYEPPNWFYRKFSNYVHLWIFTSKALKERFYRPVDNYKILSAGFDDSVFHLEEKSVALANKTYLACMICHVDKNKGVDRLLALAKALPERRFALIGSGPMRMKVEEFSRKYCNLDFFGSLSAAEVKSTIESSVCCLSLSRNESFGLTIAEAQACGTPVIATRTDGSREQLGDSERVVEQLNDAKELCGALKQAILKIDALSEPIYQDLALQVSDTAKSYSLSSVARELKLVYSDLSMEKAGE